MGLTGFGVPPMTGFGGYERLLALPPTRTPTPGGGPPPGDPNSSRGEALLALERMGKPPAGDMDGWAGGGERAGG